MTSNLNTMAVVSALIQYPTMALAVGWPLWRLCKKGRFWASVLRMWLYLVVWTILICMVVRPIVAGAFRDKHGGVDYFPDDIAIPGMIFGGWVSCILLCGLVLGIRTLWIQFRQRSH
jgi:hypothetical protein